MLVLLLLIPLLGAAVGAFVPDALARKWALAVSLADLLLAVIIACGFDFSTAGMQYVTSGFSAPQIGVAFNLGIDSISLWLILLTTLLMPLSVLASFTAIQQRPREYYAWMLALLFAMLGVFVARDLLLFYAFFELTLIPMFFIIGIWGGPERRHAAGKFFLFTFTGSVFLLASVVYLGTRYGTFGIATLIKDAQGYNLDVAGLSQAERLGVVLGLLAGFAVKVPLFPVHTWLPLAHTEAPTAGSVILAGVLLKLGTYGLFRLALPLGMIDSAGVTFPMLIKFIGALCVIGIIYGALVAWVQQDIKKLVAYSSVSHLGFCVLGLMALNPAGLEGSVLYMINHGLSTGALFLVIGMIYERFHTRDINKISGLAKRMPKLAFFMVLFTFSSIGLPGLNGFVSEFLTILGAFTSDYLGWRFGALAALGIILGAVYMLHMVARVIFGPLKVPGHEPAHDTASSTDTAGADAPQPAEELPTDIGPREVGLLIPLALAVVLLGVAPRGIMNSMRGPIDAMRGPVAAAQNTQNTALAGATNPPAHGR